MSRLCGEQWGCEVRHFDRRQICEYSTDVDAPGPHCLRRCFDIVEQNGFRSVAFPSISMGAYRFPMHAACRIAVSEAHAFLGANNVCRLVTFVCFDEEARKSYEPMVSGLFGEPVTA
tara:strand:- start:4908 stop:5258 length:351 start_codon:yes stop_codon:yes gene_type:complete